MKGIHWQRELERATYANGEANIIFWFIGAWLTSYWKFRFKRWRYDGFPRRTLELGPLVINWGRDHYWTEEST